MLRRATNVTQTSARNTIGRVKYEKPQTHGQMPECDTSDQRGAPVGGLCCSGSFGNADQESTQGGGDTIGHGVTPDGLCVPIVTRPRRASVTKIGVNPVTGAAVFEVEANDGSISKFEFK